MTHQQEIQMSDPTFEEHLTHAKAILEKLMDPQVTLEESVQLYSQGLDTIRQAQKLIDQAKQKVDTIEKAQSGVDA